MSETLIGVSGRSHDLMARQVLEEGKTCAERSNKRTANKPVSPYGPRHNSEKGEFVNETGTMCSAIQQR